MAAEELQQENQAADKRKDTATATPKRPLVAAAGGDAPVNIKPSCKATSN